MNPDHLQLLKLSAPAMPAATAFLVSLPIRTPAQSARVGATVSCRPTRAARVTVRAALHSAVPDYPVESGDDDGGDGFFGGDYDDLQKSLGVPIPEMTVQDREHLASSRNDAEHLERLLTIAKRRHGEMQMETMRKRMAMGDGYRASSADDYLQTLATNSYKKEATRMVELGFNAPEAPDFVKEAEKRVANEARLSSATSGKPTASSATSSSSSVTATIDKSDNEKSRAEIAEMEKHKIRGMNAGERYVYDLAQAAKAKEGSASGPAAPPATDATNEAEAVVKDLERQLRELIQNEDEANESLLPTLPAVAPTETGGTDGALLDKQISFLEAHLAKLQRETGGDDADAAAPVPGQVQAKISDLGSKLDMSAATAAPPAPIATQMSEEERIAAFSEIRRRAAIERGAEPADTLAISIPDRISELPRSMRDTAGAAESSDVETMRLAVIALRMESDKYLENARETLDEYEQSIAAVFKRFAPDLLH
jgi:hypothetical protein